MDKDGVQGVHACQRAGGVEHMHAAKRAGSLARARAPHPLIHMNVPSLRGAQMHTRAHHAAKCSHTTVKLRESYEQNCKCCRLSGSEDTGWLLFFSSRTGWGC